jgi:hypothetical protein
MPDNAIYYHLAYAATLLLYGGYAFSLAWRRARLARRRAGLAVSVAVRVDVEVR